MTLIFPAYLVTITNLTAGWSYDTYQGEPGDPAAVARLLDEGFGYEWGFTDGLAPGSLDPAKFGFRMSSASAAHVPDIDQGHQLVLRLQRPPGPVSRDGAGVLVGTGVDNAIDIVHQGFRCRETSAQWDHQRKRMISQINATDYLADLGAPVNFVPIPRDFAAHLDNFDYPELMRDDMQQWASVGQTWPQSAATVIVPKNSSVHVINRFGINQPDPGGNPFEGGGKSLPRMRGAGVISVREAVERLAALQFTNDVSVPFQGVYVPVVAGSLDQVPFPLVAPNYRIESSPIGSDDSGFLYFGTWTPSAELTVAPFVLAVVAGLLTSVDSGATDLHTNAGMLLLDASHVRESPEWRRSASTAVNTVGIQGRNSVIEDESSIFPTIVDVLLTVTDRSAVEKYGPVARVVTTMASFEVGGIDAGLLRPEILSLIAPIYLTFPFGGPDWSPDSIQVLSETMTDAELDSYAARFNPRDQMQQTVVILDVSDETNMAEGDPLYTTMTGCRIAISRGRLIFEPRLRPIVPLVTGDAAVTWNDIQTSYPTQTWDDLDPTLTWARMALTAA